MKNGELLIANQALGQLANLAMPITTALKVRRMARQMGPMLEDIEAERKRLLERYAVRDADGKPRFEDEAKSRYALKPEFYIDWQALLDADSAAEIAPIMIAELGEITIQPAVLMGMGDLIVDAEPAAAPAPADQSAQPDGYQHRRRRRRR